MDADTGKLKSRLNALNGALDDLESELEPLLAQTLPETVVGLDTIQQAKLQVAIPYLVYDLVFIYLKTRGIDPKSHPVIGELDRIKQYFDKLKNAEDPAKRSVAVDKAAANRFIKHAIAQVTAHRPPGDDEAPAHIRFNEDGSTPIPVKVTSKMLAREQYQRELKEAGSEEDDDLEVIDDEGEPEAEIIDLRAAHTDKGKAKATDKEDPDHSGPRKRRRPAVDPFAGYGDEAVDNANETTKRSKVASEGNSTQGKSPAAGSRSGSTESATKTATDDKKAAKKTQKAKRKESTT